MTTYSGRVESKYTVPASTTVSVSSGALTSAVSVTWPAASYFHSAIGGVSSGLAALQTAINAAVSPYPDNATSVTAMLGYGDFSSGAGWGFNIASGNDTGIFGGVTMTAVSSPTYHNTGPGQGTDYAVGFDSAADAFSAGDVFDASADLIVMWVAKASASANGDIISKGWNSGGAGTVEYLVAQEATNITFYIRDPAGSTYSISCLAHVGSWHAGIAVLDRTAGKARVATRSLEGTESLGTNTTVVLPAVGHAQAFIVGAGGGYGAPTSVTVSAVYASSGSSIASGLSTNLSTALTNFANAVNSAFSVSMSTSTGLVTLSNSFWPCSLDFDANTMSLLGFAYDMDAPQTAAQVTAALGGYGDFTSGAGYLCNEASGDLASVFGTPATLTASSLTYGALGARGGADKAIGFDAGTDYASGGDVFDVGATDDLIVAWVARHAAAPTVSGDILFSKYTAAGGGWQVYAEVAGGTHAFYCASTVPAELLNLTGVSLHVGAWHCGIAVIDRSTGKARYGTISLLDGTVSVSSETAIAATSMANASNFQVGDRADVASAAPQDCKIAAFYVVTGSGVATGLSANLSAALSNFATYMKSQTGTQQAKGVWFPDCPLSIDGDPAQAPKVTDRRSTVSPTGTQFSLVGNSYRRHRGVMWTHVPRASTWESAATYTNGSYETFANDCFYGLGHSWFTPASPVQIYWNDAGTQRAVGYTYNSSAGMAGWYVVNVDSTEPRPSVDGWTGLFRIEFGDIVGVGA